MDGTLVDTEGLWWQAVEHVASTVEYRLTDADLPDVLGMPVEHTADLLRRATGASLESLTADLRREFSARMAGRILPRPGAVELLDRLRRDGITIGLVSASPRSVVDTVLGVLGTDRFAVTVSADDTERTKPAPDPYLAAARLLGVRACDCVVVEDTPAGVASAEAAGCRVVAVPSSVPIPPAPGRVVLDSLERAGLPLLRALAAEAPVRRPRGGRPEERPATT